MPRCQTKFHGLMGYAPEQVLQIPDGFFGFASEKEWLLLEVASLRPLVFIQSVRTATLCFLALPAQVVESDYELVLRQEDREWFADHSYPSTELRPDLLCLALLTLGEGQSATANLQAPLVIDIARHRGKQVIADAHYSHVHAFTTESIGVPC